MKKRIVLALLPITLFSAGFNKDMQNYIDSLKAEAKQQNSKFIDFDVQRGKEIFTSTHIGKRGKPLSCTSCHTNDLRQNGENIHTGKILDPLSPHANPKSMVKVKQVKKWLRRNFKDVYNRVGTAQEKGDVIYFIVKKIRRN